MEFAPGSRVVIRDAEWVVQRVDNSSDGGYQVTCVGISELVQGKTAVFLDKLDRVEVLDPAKTELVQDLSGGYRDSLLYLESLLRRTVPNDDHIHVADRAAMDVVPFQLDPAKQALRQPRQRILIADAVGLGKTLEAGILVTELIQRGRGKRILVLTLKSMLTQFQKEFWNRFTIPLTRLDSIGLQRVRSRIPTNHNPFYYYDKSIISIDTLKQDSEYRVYLEQAYWDIIIIDEAHNVAERGNGGRSLRARLAKLLANRSDTLIMLSATPHDGSARSFASLMNMLDPTAIADPDEYISEDFRTKGLVIRRFKKDIQAQVEGEFRDRRIFNHATPATLEEEEAYDALLQVRFTWRGHYDQSKPTQLLRVTLQKSLFSSPAACCSSIVNRIKELKKQGNGEITGDIANEIEHLEYLKCCVAAIVPERYGKYQKLLHLLRTELGWSPRRTDDRLVIFSERIDTLKFLENQLSRDLALKEDQVALLHGGLSDIDQQSLVEKFGQESSPLRLLLCSDVASEGINLHYLCHRLIHFDMPWSLMVFQQRNGRVDRYGQEKTPEIHYLTTESGNDTIRGDLRILEVLRQKDEQAYRNIGDPSAFMGVCDQEKEEELTAEAMAEGIGAESFDLRYLPKQTKADELLALFLGIGENPSAAETPDPENFSPRARTLFADDFSFCREALQRLHQEGHLSQPPVNRETKTISLVASEDLRYRFSQLPREIYPEDWQFVLTQDKEQIQQEVKRCRQDEEAWPKIHFLWPQHPVVEWLQDRLLVIFGRHKAPVLELGEGLAPRETVFIVAGQVPNRKGHPLIHEWLGVCFRGSSFHGIEPFSKTLERTRLGQQPIPNRGRERDLADLRKLLPQAVREARRWVIAKRDEFDVALQAKLTEQLSELERLHGSQHRQLELALKQSAQAEGFKKAKRRRREEEIDDLFKRHRQWVHDTLTTERRPYLQVVAALV